MSKMWMMDARIRVCLTNYVFSFLFCIFVFLSESPFHATLLGGLVEFERPFRRTLTSASRLVAAGENVHDRIVRQIRFVSWEPNSSSSLPGSNSPAKLIVVPEPRPGQLH